MKFLLSVAALAAAASAASFNRTTVMRRSSRPLATSPLEVKVEMIGNTAVRASVTNMGTTTLKLLKTGTFLDTGAVEKIKIKESGGNHVAFDGIRLRMDHSNLPNSAFRILGARETVTAELDAGELHDLSPGGAYDLYADGVFSYSYMNSTKLQGSLRYSSNVVKAQVNGTKAERVRRAYLKKRTEVQEDCWGRRYKDVAKAVAHCNSLARHASETASTDPGKVKEFFKDDAPHVMKEVADVFDKVADECASISDGGSRYYCSDIYESCSKGVLAYTLPSKSKIVSCSAWFDLPTQSDECHAQDQPSTVLHEMTHLRFVKGTEDYGGYGYDYIQTLDEKQRLNHADTYAVFAQSIFAGC